MLSSALDTLYYCLVFWTKTKRVAYSVFSTLRKMSIGGGGVLESVCWSKVESHGPLNLFKSHKIIKSFLAFFLMFAALLRIVFFSSLPTAFKKAYIPINQAKNLCQANIIHGFYACMMLPHGNVLFCFPLPWLLHAADKKLPTSGYITPFGIFPLGTGVTKGPRVC